MHTHTLLAPWHAARAHRLRRRRQEPRAVVAEAGRCAHQGMLHSRTYPHTSWMEEEEEEEEEEWGWRGGTLFTGKDGVLGERWETLLQG